MMIRCCSLTSSTTSTGSSSTIRHVISRRRRQQPRIIIQCTINESRIRTTTSTSTSTSATTLSSSTTTSLYQPQYTIRNYQSTIPNNVYTKRKRYNNSSVSTGTIPIQNGVDYFCNTNTTTVTYRTFNSLYNYNYNNNIPPSTVGNNNLHRIYFSTTNESTNNQDTVSIHPSSTSTATTIPTNMKRMFLPTLYRYLQLELFTREEIDTIFYKITSDHNDNNLHPVENENDNVITLDNLTEFLYGRIQTLDEAMTIISTTNFNTSNDKNSSNSSIDRQRVAGEIVRNDSVDSNTSNHNNNVDDSERQEYLTSLHVLHKNRARYDAIRIMKLLISSSSDTSNDKNNNDMSHYTITKDEFYNIIINISSSVDIRSTIPIATSMLLVGVSVGIMTPAMPFVIDNLQLTATEYGMVVSAFALTKLLGNIPAAVAVEEYGRKPFMVYSLAPLMAIAVAGIGYAHNFSELFICRLLAGAGVAALSTAGTLMTTDLSTPLNRASTLAPIMSAFAAGTALGPAVGGILVDTIGLQLTFYSVGLSFLSCGIINKFLLYETHQKTQYFTYPWTIQYNKILQPKLIQQQQLQQQLTSLSSSSNNNTTTISTIKSSPIYNAVSQWMPLLKDTSVRNVMIMNGVYWVALAGSQMTLLPLLLTSTSGSFAMSATQVGQVYMGMSLVQFVGNPIFAKITDKIGGQSPAIISGCALIGCSMAVLPVTSTLPQLYTTLAIWSAGSSMLSTAPIAYISDAVAKQQHEKTHNNNKTTNYHQQNDISHDSTTSSSSSSSSSSSTEKTTVNTSTKDNSNNSGTKSKSSGAQAQAIALLRTCGDVGFLFGAAGIGALADYTNSVEVAMQCSSIMLLSATTWFTITKRKFLQTALLSLSSSTKSSSLPITATTTATTIATTKKKQ